MRLLTKFEVQLYAGGSQTERELAAHTDLVIEDEPKWRKNPDLARRDWRELIRDDGSVECLRLTVDSWQRAMAEAPRSPSPTRRYAPAVSAAHRVRRRRSAMRTWPAGPPAARCGLLMAHPPAQRLGMNPELLAQMPERRPRPGRALQLHRALAQLDRIPLRGRHRAGSSHMINQHMILSLQQPGGDGHPATTRTAAGLARWVVARSGVEMICRNEAWLTAAGWRCVISGISEQVPPPGDRGQ
jgi:hypothetical protein